MSESDAVIGPILCHGYVRRSRAETWPDFGCLRFKCLPANIFTQLFLKTGFVAVKAPCSSTKNQQNAT